jgi:hypothetical protein
MPLLVLIRRTNKPGGSVSNLPEMTGLPCRFKDCILDPSQRDRLSSARPFISHHFGRIQTHFPISL